MLSLVKQRLLWQMLLLTSLGWLFGGCNKDDVADVKPIGDQKVEGSSIEMIEGRLVFENKAHLDETLTRIAHGDNVEMPEKFVSYYETYEKFINVDWTDEEFISFVESQDFQKYFRIIIDEEGLKSMEPIWNSKLYGEVLSKNLEIQIGDDVIRYDSENEYHIEAPKYVQADFKTIAKEVFPIQRNVLSQDFGRDVTLDDCTEYFGKKNGSWQNKMQGKIMFTGTSTFNEWTIETRSRKRSVFGWWVSNDKYDLELNGTITVQVFFNNGNSPQYYAHNIDEDCSECPDLIDGLNRFYLPYGQNTIDHFNLVSITSTHRLECNNDCSGESSTGWMQCSNSE